MLSRLNVFCQRVGQSLKLSCTSRKYTSIPDFYRDRSVLVTGATGFLGQGLVEKLLRSCPDIGRIYICVRPDKYGKTEQKYHSFLQNEVFKILRGNSPDFDTKIVPFKGDITEDNFGINDALLLAEMTEKVSVIFHCAADIRLMPSLRVSVKGNILGSKNVFDFGKKCQNLCAYVHVSTTFSNFHRDHVEEKIYQASSSPDELIYLIQKHDDAYLLKHKRQIVTASLTYTFCKKVAENVVLERDYGKKTAVFRSCFISPALSEPFPYWMYGDAGYVLILKNVRLQVTKGTVKFLHGNPSNPVENLPVDMIVNSLINVGWYLGTGRHGDTDPLVVNVNSSTDNPVTLKDLVTKRENIVMADGAKQELVKTLSPTMWKGTSYYGQTAWMVQAKPRLFYVVLTLPAIVQALLQDIVVTFKGGHPTNLQRLQKLRRALTYLETSTSRHPSYDFENAKKIHNLLRESDQKMFPFDVGSIHWKNYLPNWIQKVKEDGKSKQI